MQSREQIKKWMKEIKGGDFPNWYNSLTQEEKQIYREEFEKLQNPPSPEIGSEGVFDNLNQSNK